MTPPWLRRKPTRSDSTESAGASLELDTLESRVARAAGSPLIRGGLIIVSGIITGNILGFGRVALTAFLLGTHSAADSLAVAIGPIDTINAALVNTIIFAFVPLLTERDRERRIALFRKVKTLFVRFFVCVTAAVLILAPWLIRLLAPGLPVEYVPQATNLLRIGSLSTMGVGVAGIYSALLFTDRRFAPSAFQQAILNISTIVAALTLWRVVGIYGFAIGYMVGAWIQLATVYLASRKGLRNVHTPECELHWRDIAAKPAWILLYSIFLALNITATRAYATHVGPGTAAALDYSMRCIGVPVAFLVLPLSNSLLPEIARLRSLFRIREAFQLIDRTLALAGLAAVAACIFGVLVRQPAIALLYQRGSFTANSTQLVANVFLGLAPSLIGWSLLELTARSLFALNRPSLPLVASAVPVLCNLALLAGMHSVRPELIGLGASVGFLCGFALLITLAHVRRNRWLDAG